MNNTDQVYVCKRYIAPGIWIDGNDNVHFAVPEILAHLNVPDTPENREIVAEIARRITTEHGAQLVERMPDAAGKFTIAVDGKSITCHKCGRTSWNLNDVQQLYCGHCHTFHQFT